MMTETCFGFGLGVFFVGVRPSAGSVGGWVCRPERERRAGRRRTALVRLRCGRPSARCRRLQRRLVALRARLRGGRVSRLVAITLRDPVDGTAWCWGMPPGSARPCRPANRDRFRCRSVAPPTGPQSAPGRRHLRDPHSGTPWCWGDNYAGELRDGDLQQMLVPTQVGTVTTGPRNAGGRTCGTRTDHTAWCWGLGRAWCSATARTAAMLPGTGRHRHRLGRLSAGGCHTCGTRIDGTAWCWGYNHYGQLGDGTHQLVPSSAGRHRHRLGHHHRRRIHTCGIRTDGTAWCWGDNRPVSSATAP